MKVFLSWSGEASHAIAEKLYEWLPMVVQKVSPYISSEIDKGSRWATDIAKELEECSFGIACVTRENISAPWLLFEAGALSKSVHAGRLAPVLFGIEQSDVQKSPLTQFQMTKFDKEEFRKLVHSLNDALLENSLEIRTLDGVFDALWPSLDTKVEQVLTKVIDPSPSPSSSRAQVDRVTGALEELITSTRNITQTISSPTRVLPPEYLESILHHAVRGGLSTVDIERLYDRIRRAQIMFDRLSSAEPEERIRRMQMLGESLSEARMISRQMMMGRRRMSPNSRGLFSRADANLPPEDEDAS